MPTRPELTAYRRSTMTLKSRVGRELVKGLLSTMVRWQPMGSPVSGYSIVLGVPWDLRNLLPVNLQFIEKTSLEHLHTLYIVFDRRSRPEAAELIQRVCSEHPTLPMEFIFYPPVAGKIIESVNVSTFYNSMNTVLALRQCRTQYAVLHDFDLYPLVPEYFEAVYSALVERQLHFCGLEITPFEGLSEDDMLLGTWCLGLDVQWLRANFSPIDCFHKVSRIGDRVVSLDPYSWIQTKTSKRGLVQTVGGDDCCHVKNLCSTYLRFVNRQWAVVVWRLHYVWYLEYVCGSDLNFRCALDAMACAESPILCVGGYDVDFSTTDVSCANVLESELVRMETNLYGKCRPDVARYIDAFRDFLRAYGRQSVVAEDE